MSPSKSVDPADEGYKAPDSAGPDEEAEAQEETRALLKTHGEDGPVKPPPPDAEYPAGEAAPGFHLGPPKRVNCPKCGHAHQVSYDVCQRCGASLKSVEKDAAAV